GDLPPFVVAPNPASTPTRTANGIQFVNEDDGGRGRPSLREQITHATRADADDHFDELAGAHAEEWHVGLAGNGACQQCFASTGWADQQEPWARLRPGGCTCWAL